MNTQQLAFQANPDLNREQSDHHSPSNQQSPVFQKVMRFKNLRMQNTEELGNTRLFHDVINDLDLKDDAKAKDVEIIPVAHSHSIITVCERTNDLPRFSNLPENCKSEGDICKSENLVVGSGDHFDYQYKVLSHLLRGTGKLEQIRHEWFTAEQQKLLALIKKHGMALSSKLIELELKGCDKEWVYVATAFNLSMAALPTEPFDSLVACLNLLAAKDKAASVLEKLIPKIQSGQSLDQISTAFRDAAVSLGSSHKFKPENAGTWALQNIPLPDILIEGMLDNSGKMELVAASKQGKSFAVLQMAISLATGTNWLGFPVPKKRRVLIVQFEISPSCYHQRLNLMLNAMGIKPHELEDRLHIQNCLGNTPSASDLLSLAMGYDVLIIDPLYKLIEGDENKAQDVKPILAAMDVIWKETGAAIVFVHHQAKGKSGDKYAIDRGAGSGVIGRDVTTMVTIDRHEDEENQVIEIVYRNGKPIEPFTVRRETVMLVRVPLVQPIVQSSSSRRTRKQPPIQDAIELLKGDGWIALTAAEQKLTTNGWTTRGAKTALQDAHTNKLIDRKDGGKSHRAMIRVLTKSDSSGPPEDLSI